MPGTDDELPQIRAARRAEIQQQLETQAEKQMQALAANAFNADNYKSFTYPPRWLCRCDLRTSELTTTVG